MIYQQGTEGIDQVIRVLLDELSKHYFTDASMLPLILSNDEKRTRNLHIIDGLRQSVLTSLQFEQYRRAVWYLQALSSWCAKTFEDSNQEHIIRALRKRIRNLG